MAYKFPLPRAPFPPLAMADKERVKLEKLGHQLVREALADFDAHRQANSQVSRRDWKPVRSREQLTMYKQIGSSSRQTRRSPTSPGTTHWKLPTMLQVGSIHGSLHDVMYGVHTVDAVSMLLKTTYTQDTLVDAETLCQLRGPSEKHPFRFVGVKWVVKTTPAGVRPRDLVFLETCGIITREGRGGRVERVGYHLMHSINVLGYGPLDDSKVVRAQLSSCSLFAEAPGQPDTVQVYMKANLDPRGSVSEGVATHSASLDFMSCSRAVVCARSKKLAWLLRCRPSAPSADALVSPAGARRCPICAKPVGLFSVTSNCELCYTAVCSDCFVKKKLTLPGHKRKTFVQRSVRFCTSCLTHAARTDALEVARQELLVNGDDGYAHGQTPLTPGTATSASALPYYSPEALPNCRQRPRSEPISRQTYRQQMSAPAAYFDRESEVDVRNVAKPAERFDFQTQDKAAMAIWNSGEDESRRARTTSRFQESELDVDVDADLDVDAVLDEHIPMLAEAPLAVEAPRHTRAPLQSSYSMPTHLAPSSYLEYQMPLKSSGPSFEDDDVYVMEERAFRTDSTPSTSSSRSSERDSDNYSVGFPMPNSPIGNSRDEVVARITEKYGRIDDIPPMKSGWSSPTSRCMPRTTVGNSRDEVVARITEKLIASDLGSSPPSNRKLKMADLSPQQSTPADSRGAVMARFAAMRVAAEKAYQQAQRNAKAHQETASSARARHFNFGSARGGEGYQSQAR